MAGSASFSKLAGGNIHPSRFVKLHTDGTVVECAAGADIWATSQPNTDRLAGPIGVDDGLAGRLGGPPVNIFGPGDDEAPLELGGGVLPGQRIKSGAAGVGVVATLDKDKTGAICVRGGSSGDIVPVKPQRLDLGV